MLVVQLYHRDLYRESEKNSKMEKDKFVNVIENVKDKSNKDLFETEEFLFKQHEDLKNYIVNLTHKLETIENLHSKVLEEIENRKIK